MIMALSLRLTSIIESYTITRSQVRFNNYFSRRLQSKLFFCQLKTLSNLLVRNPPPLCVGVPHLKEEASICIKFYKLDARNKSLSGCVDLIVKLANLEVARVKMGCFHLANKSRYFEQRMFSYYMTNNNNWTHTYDNFRKEINRFDMFGKYAYNNLLNKFKEKMEVPKISFSFAPNSLIGNIYGSVFSSTNSPIGSGRQLNEAAVREKDATESNDIIL
jgi:hypothetical protein